MTRIDFLILNRDLDRLVELRAGRGRFRNCPILMACRDRIEFLAFDALAAFLQAFPICHEPLPPQLRPVERAEPSPSSCRSTVSQIQSFIFFSAISRPLSLCVTLAGLVASRGFRPRPTGICGCLRIEVVGVFISKVNEDRVDRDHQRKRVFFFFRLLLRVNAPLPHSCW